MDLRVFPLYQKRLFHQNMEIMVHIKYADKRNATYDVTFKEADFYVFRHGNFRIIFKQINCVMNVCYGGDEQ